MSRGRGTTMLQMGAALVLLTSLCTNLETSRTFPSWLDEAFFGNLAFNLSQHHSLVADVIVGYPPGEVLFYGPVYFYLQAWLIDLFGLHSITFRLPNLFGAYATAAFIGLHLRDRGVTRVNVLLFLVAAIVDVSFNRNLVSGRMDMLATALAAFALYLAGRPLQHPVANTVRWMAVGLACATAFLTTPRALFLLPAVAVAFMGHSAASHSPGERWRSAGDFVISALAFTAPVVLWISHVGGLRAYIELFTGNPLTASHVAPSLFRSSYDNVAIALLLVLATLQIRQVLRHAWIAGLLATFLCFSLFVREHGPYAAMIMPTVLATVVALLDKAPYRTGIKVAAAILLILPGLGLLSLRGLDLVLNSACRDASPIQRLSRSIEPGTNVVAPFKYYFLLERSDRNLVTLEYARHDTADTITRAGVVVAEPALGETLAARGFARTMTLECSPRRVWPLPETFYRRSTYDEAVYGKR